MVEETPEDAGPESGRSRRTPPTIDLQATEVTAQPQEGVDPAAGAEATARSEAAADADTARAEPEPQASEPPGAKPISPWVIAPFSGAVAAALVIAVGWMLGWPAVQAPAPAATPAAPQVSAATVDALGARLTGLEAKINKPAPPPATDAAMTARIDAIEKSVSDLRNDVGAVRAQSEKLATSVNEVSSAPHDASPAPAPDLAGIEDRLTQLEHANHAASAQIAQQGEKLGEVAQQSEKTAEAKPADDLPLRRVVAASLLDVAVRHGDPYARQLAAAKSLSPDSNEFKPLEPFASTGVPAPAALCRELLNIVPKLTPAAEAHPSGGSIVDRLQAGAAKLVRIERTDGTGTDRGAVVARITSAAIRNDLAEAAREVKALSPPDRAPAQAWLDKVDARDAALAASRKLADDSMTALAKPAP